MEPIVFNVAFTGGCRVVTLNADNDYTYEIMVHEKTDEGFHQREDTYWLEDGEVMSLTRTSGKDCDGSYGSRDVYIKTGERTLPRSGVTIAMWRHFK